MNVYQVLIRPILTEKTDLQRDDTKYVFEVDAKANKHQVKEAVEKIFDVKVASVNTMVISQSGAAWAAGGSWRGQAGSGQL